MLPDSSKYYRISGTTGYPVHSLNFRLMMQCGLFLVLGRKHGTTMFVARQWRPVDLASTQSRVPRNSHFCVAQFLHKCFHFL